MPKDVLVCEGLKVSVEGRYILNNVNLTLREGEVAVITGATGAGKSTLLKVFSGIIPELYPSFSVNGSVLITGLKPQEAAGEGLLAYVPQDVSAYFIGSRVDDELMFRGLKCLPKHLPEGVRCDSLIHQLSDGQLYRLLITSSLASGVKLLMLDEPTTHVDPWVLPEVLRMVKTYCVRGGASAIIVEHRVDKVSGEADRILELVNGCLKPCVSRELSIADPLIHKPLSGCGIASLRSVRFTYDGVNEVLRGVSLSVDRGEVVAILGRNGAGKSTLLKVMAGSLKPLSGEVIVKGRAFIIPQSPIHWFCTYSVEEEVKLYAKAWGFKGSIESVLSNFMLNDLRDRVPHTLSAGESRRLSLALSTVSGADLVLMDEPSIGLDHRSFKSLIKCVDLIAANGGAVVMATHDERLARYADKSFILEEGVLRPWPLEG